MEMNLWSHIDVDVLNDPKPMLLHLYYPKGNLRCALPPLPCVHACHDTNEKKAAK